MRTQRCCSTVLLTSVLDVGGWSAPRSGRFTPGSNQPTKGLTRGRLLHEAQSTSPRLFSLTACDRISRLSNRLTILRLGLCITLTGLRRSLGLRTGIGVFFLFIKHTNVGGHTLVGTLPPVNTWYALYRRLGGSQGRSLRVRKISSPLGFDSMTV
jgi:hypothetical protein